MVLGSDEVMKEEVAVKTMEDGASEGDMIKFLQEAAIMGQFDHPNIVKILGIVVRENEVRQGWRTQLDCFDTTDAYYIYSKKI